MGVLAKKILLQISLANISLATLFCEGLVGTAIILLSIIEKMIPIASLLIVVAMVKVTIDRRGESTVRNIPEVDKHGILTKVNICLPARQRAVENSVNSENLCFSPPFL